MLVSMLVLLAPGCDRDGGYYVADPNPDFPFIQDLGEFRVISEDERNDFSSTYSEEARAEDELRRKGVHYGGLGAPADPSYYGGATFNFLGTGGDVCVVVDPEAVFWNQAQSPQADTSSFLYLDNTKDDADLDLDVGLSAYYTGSPGVEMGDFELVYSDPGGEDHNLSFSECAQLGYQKTPSHSGRSTLEYCTVNTRSLQGVSMTGVLDTFLLPIDDGVAHFALGVFEGNCSNVVVAPQGLDPECFLQREATGALDIDDKETTEEYCDDPDNAWNYVCLEQKFCDKTKKLNAYCEDHFDDDDAPCIDNGAHPPADDAEADIGL